MNNDFSTDEYSGNVVSAKNNPNQASPMNRSNEVKHQWTGDVSPLNAHSLDRLNIHGLGWALEHLSRFKSAAIKIGGILAVLLVALLLFFFERMGAASLFAALFFIFFAFLPIGIILFVVFIAIYQLWIVRGRDRQAFSAFAQQNGLTYLPGPDRQAVLKSSLSKVTNSSWIEHQLAGVFGGLPFRMFKYNHRLSSYSLGGGKRRKIVSLYVIEITLPRKMPHLVVDSLVESEGIFRASALPIRFDGSLRMELEGNFYKSFDIYTSDRDAVTNLAVLSPDVMVMLMDHAVQYDMEIVEDKFYLYTSDVSSLNETIADIYQTASRIFQKIGRQLTTANILTDKKYFQDITGYSGVSGDPMTEELTEAKYKRLKINNKMSATSIIIFGYVLHSLYLTGEFSTTFLIILFLIGVAALIIVRMLIKNRD